MKITDKQMQHLQVLAGGERSAYPGLSMGTLRALERKGLIQARRGLGSMFSPRTSVKWWLSFAGKQVLKEGSK